MRYTEDRRTLFFGLLTAGLFFVAGGSVSAAPPTVGEPAPPFRFVGVEGLAYESADFFSPIPPEAGSEATPQPDPGEAADRRGRAVVIAWFPKAFTPG
jgi:hypothetical protein